VFRDRTDSSAAFFLDDTKIFSTTFLADDRGLLPPNSASTIRYRHIIDIYAQMAALSYWCNWTYDACRTPNKVQIMPHKSTKRRSKDRPLLRTAIAKLKGLAAINRVRKGKSPTLHAAAKAEHTTVPTIRKNLSAAIMQDQKGKRIRVKSGDPYSIPVEVLTDSGPQVVKARGSRERELAGQHRAVYGLVLGKKLPPSALSEFRDKKVGGQNLLSDYGRLSVLANAGVLGQLDSLYVSPGSGA
jgi:hypothetical protein